MIRGDADASANGAASSPSSSLVFTGGDGRFLRELERLRQPVRSLGKQLLTGVRAGNARGPTRPLGSQLPHGRGARRRRQPSASRPRFARTRRWGPRRYRAGARHRTSCIACPGNCDRSGAYRRSWSSHGSVPLSRGLVGRRQGARAYSTTCSPCPDAMSGRGRSPHALTSSTSIDFGAPLLLEPFRQWPYFEAKSCGFAYSAG